MRNRYRPAIHPVLNTLLPALTVRAALSPVSKARAGHTTTRKALSIASLVDCPEMLEPLLNLVNLGEPPLNAAKTQHTLCRGPTGRWRAALFL